jgi:hypothetical protein
MREGVNQSHARRIPEQPEHVRHSLNRLAAKQTPPDVRQGGSIAGMVFGTDHWVFGRERGVPADCHD